MEVLLNWFVIKEVIVLVGVKRLMLIELELLINIVIVIVFFIVLFKVNIILLIIFEKVVGINILIIVN